VSEGGRTSPGTLFVVGTPIGNLEDVTLRALRVLAEAAVVVAEDTRVTARLLARHGIGTPCVSCREQNAARAVPAIVARLLAGEDAALVSDAGTPSVSDPGEQLVRAAVEAGVAVTPVPGPSALAAAASVAALPGEGIRFIGFLPRAGKPRRARLAAIAEDPACVVLYESPNRLGATLEELAAACPGRQAVVMRELTKIHEEIARGTLEQLAARFAGDVRGEITIAVAGNQADDGAPDEARLREIVARQIAAGKSAKDVAASLSAALGTSRKLVYRMALEGMGERDGPE
jgi:16S rRNA (cytidine1402-2'-O)-methyltransferase